MISQDQEENIQKAKALVERLRHQYTDDPNIETVGWGLAQRGGKSEDGTSIIFFVKEKLSSQRSILGIGSRPIPVGIEGFNTDVQELKKSTSKTPADEYITPIPEEGFYTKPMEKETNKVPDKNKTKK